MNYSLEINHKDGLDVVSFFHLEKAVLFPSELWFQVIATSLRMKHDVLILEAPITEFPQWNKNLRWQTGDNWCWLAPRSLSVISKVYLDQSQNYQDFKVFLKTSK